MKNKINFLITTKKVEQEMEQSSEFLTDVLECLKRFENCDWGDLCKEDCQLNDDVVYKGVEDRIFASYNTTKGGIYIITEFDKKITTILFKEEY